MFGLWKERTFEDPQLGVFKRTRTTWLSAATTGGLGVGVEGDKQRPSPSGLQVARLLLQNPREPIQAAEAFVMRDARVLEFMEGNGKLICDGFTVYLSGQFAVEFSLTEWPDAMITVQFESNVPCGVELAD